MGDSQITDSISRARAELQKEYQRIGEESQAFDKFRKHIVKIEIHEPRSDGGTRLGVPIQSLQQTTRPKQCDWICQAYRETVMNVSHFEKEYNESLHEHMAAEFGPDIVDSLFGCNQLTPHIKRGLLEASQQSSYQRTKFRTSLDVEFEDLKRAQSTLNRISDCLVEWNEQPLSEYSFSQLQEIYNRLTDFEHRCKQLAIKRQRDIHVDVWPSPDDSVRGDLQRYLYHGLDITYPILAGIAVCCIHLQKATRSVEKSISVTV